jgi:RNA polymerase sigma-70 factor (ECF subfamily)
MSDTAGNSTILLGLLQRLAAGDPHSRDQIIAHSMQRLERLARKMLRANPAVRRWNETGDVLQNSLLRLHRALQAVAPTSAREFIGLAGLQIRRELIDLHRSHYGPEGLGRHHHSTPNVEESPALRDPYAVESEDDKFDRFEMEEFHSAVGSLPDDACEVFHLIFYEDVTQEDVAVLLRVSTKTIKRRWREARLLLQERLGKK